MLTEQRPIHLSNAEDPPGPLCDETEFADLIQEMVADEAPRLFAIVQEYGERVDARVAGWGMWFGNRAVAFDLTGRTMIMRSMASTMRLFRRAPHINPRLCWIGPEPAEDDEPA